MNDNGDINAEAEDSDPKFTIDDNEESYVPERETP